MTTFVKAMAIILALAFASGLVVYLYGRFATRRPGQRTNALPRADDAPLDQIAVERLDGHPGSSVLKLLDDGPMAFAVRACSARLARRSLDLQYYYWKDDLTGTLLAGEVLRAADRGVRVRLLLDDVNLRGRDATYLSLDAHENVEVRVFNPSWNRVGPLQRGFELIFRAYSSTRRMHNKAWIADGRLAIVGGRNIGDAYFDAADSVNFRDLDLIVAGRALDDAEAVFDAFWNSACVFPIASLPGIDTGDLTRLRTEIGLVERSDASEPYRNQLEAISCEHILDNGPHALHLSEKARIISDPPEKASGARDRQWLHREIIPELLSARKRLEITSPYFIPGARGVGDLAALVDRGVSVSVLTNSLAATDVAAVHGAYSRYRRSLVKRGVKLYELRPDVVRNKMSLFGSRGASLHTKAFTVDGLTGFVGSFNFDPRSVSLNTEMGVLFENAGLVAELQAIFGDQIDPHSSYRLAMQGPVLTWAADREDGPHVWRSEPVASVGRRLIAQIVRWLPIESQL